VFVIGCRDDSAPTHPLMIYQPRGQVPSADYISAGIGMWINKFRVHSPTPEPPTITDFTILTTLQISGLQSFHLYPADLAHIA
jgi:hypothetical protein